MLSRIAFLGVIVASLLGNPAEAGVHACVGEAGGVSVVIRTDEDGVEEQRWVDWSIRDSKGRAWNSLSLNYDLEGRRLGSVQAAYLMHHFEIGGSPPKSRAAEFVVQVDGIGNWRRPWGQYEAMSELFREENEPLAVTGGFPLASPDDDPPLAGLLDALDTGRVAVLRLVGSDGEPLDEVSYDLSRRTERDRDLAIALDEAEAAAENWRECEEPIV